MPFPLFLRRFGTRFARILLEPAGDGRSPAQRDAEGDARFDASFAEADRGAFATEDEVKVLRAEHGL